MINIYKKIINKFPNHNKDKFIFTMDNLPKLESKSIEINDLIVAKHWHFYNDFHRIEDRKSVV